MAEIMKDVVRIAVKVAGHYQECRKDVKEHIVIDCECN